jgi:glutaminyl-tRNA synthetase
MRSRRDTPLRPPLHRPDPEADASRHFTEFLNPDSLRCVNAWGEPSLTELLPGETVQFERLAYFCADLRLSRPGQPVMNRTVTLKEARGKN